MLDAMPLGCHLWDSDFTMIDCNEAALKLYGFKNKQEQFDNFFRCAPEFQPDGRPSDEKAILVLRKAFNEGNHVCEWLHQTRDGAPLPVELSLVRLRYKNEYIVAAYSRDLRDIKTAHHHIKLMFDAMPLGCHLWNSDIRMIACNEASLKLFGYVDQQEQIEKFFACSPEFQPDGRRSDEKAAMLVRKALKEGNYSCEWVHQSLDGKLIPAELIFVRVKYGHETIVAVYTRDLRRIKKMEKNIHRLETEVGKIYYDPLTGIYNRRFFDTNLKRVMKSLGRCRGTLSLMMIDIDYFKRYNDAYGHNEGDKCLKIVAGALAKTVKRVDDFVARYGGEEFVAVLPHTDESGARRVADKMLHNIRACNIAHEMNEAANCVTISIGVVTGQVKHSQHESEFIRRADELLYTSKQNGRNTSTCGVLETAS
jgi:diguanylate cyclase (GGDEF)-like protein